MVKTAMRRINFLNKGLVKLTLTLSLLFISSTVSAQLFVGTALNPSSTNHDAYEINVTSGAATSLFARAVWGATYDIAGKRVLFTSDGGIGGDTLYEWVPGAAAPVLLGSVTDPSGTPFRIDGLAISNGQLYGSRAAAFQDGLYQIDLNTLVATLVIPWTDSISGLDANPVSGELSGVNDTLGALVKIDVGTGTVTIVTAYPPSEDDIDGLAVSPGGLAYLIPDDATPGEFFVYNLVTNSYEASLQGPWTTSDIFSGGAYIEAPVAIPVPTLSRLGLLMLALLLVAAAVYRTRERGFFRN